MTCCVYIHRNASGEALYVGMSRDVWKRSVIHEKSKWFDQVSSIDVQHYESVELARANEERVVKELKPRFNVDYLLTRGMNHIERRRMIVGDDHNMLRPKVKSLISKVGEHKAAKMIGMGHGTLINFIASESIVPFEKTIQKVKKYFEGETA